MMIMRIPGIFSPFRIIWMTFLRAAILVLASPFSRSDLSWVSLGVSKSLGMCNNVYDGSSDKVVISNPTRKVAKHVTIKVWRPL